jgi:hypothetical protein
MEDMQAAAPTTEDVDCSAGIVGGGRSE